jgi:TusA-related sulfurtransferase
MPVQIDTRGVSCPQPVLMTKKALGENPSGIEVLVDNNTAKNNVLRYAKNLGYKIEIQGDDDNIKITIRK